MQSASLTCLAACPARPALAETTPRIVDRLDEDEELPVVREPDEQ